jgi:3-phosphoshikimate 1-carboxyvinyltransferase
MHVKIGPAKRLTGEISLPGDKSISHRAAMLGSIASGKTRISNFASSADCAATILCFQQLGVPIIRSGTDVVISGSGKRGLRVSDAPLDCANSGTTMRLMSGILAGQSFKSVLTGDDSLRSRPMKRVIDPLSQMGASINSLDGRAPLEIQGGNLNAIRYSLPVASAQIKSCVLLAGLYVDGVTTVIEPTPTRDHTERMLRGFGVDVSTRSKSEGSEIIISGESDLRSIDITVPGDVSSAAFFMVAAACLPGSTLRLKSVGLNPTRSAIIDVLRRFGAQIEIKGENETSGEPTGDIAITGGLDRPGAQNVVSGKTIANLIDEIPILAVFGTQLEGGLEVRDASELRVKESDRIRSIVENLRRMNADIEEFEDGFRVGRSKLKGATVDSFGDHRIAMAFGVAGLLAEGETEIMGAECADVSFPGFFDVLASVAS